MKSMKTLALVVGLLGLSGVSQAQFSSTWTAVSDYDFRGFSQSAKDPALQASADYAFGDSGFSMGAWASNVDFEPADGDIELDIYLNYVGKINDTFAGRRVSLTTRTPARTISATSRKSTWASMPAASRFKQWYADSLFDLDAQRACTPKATTRVSINDAVSLAFHVGYAWGDAWEAEELIDYAVQLNWTVNNFTIFGKFTGTDASDTEVTDDVNNNEPRFLVGRHDDAALGRMIAI